MFNLTASGRKRRSIDNNIVDYHEYFNVEEEDIEDQLNQYLMNHDAGSVIDQVRQMLRSLVLIDSSEECQAAIGCWSATILVQEFF